MVLPRKPYLPKPTSIPRFLFGEGFIGGVVRLEKLVHVDRTVKDPVEEYARWNSLDVNENANRYMGPTGFFSYLLEEYMKKTLLDLIPEPVLRAHINGYIYVHKLPHSLYIPYCTGHSIARLLEKGLKTPTIISRPARHFDTFVDHAANYLTTLQHYFTGAQAFSSVEWYAGPFIRRDKLDYKHVKQHVQRLVFNLNYPTRVGMQTPFTNFTVTLDAPKKMLDGDYAVYDGKKTAPLGEYRREAKTFFLALIDILYHGDMYGQPFTFPIPTLMTTADMIWKDPEIYEAVFKTAAHRGSFYWLNTRVVDPDASYAMCLYETENIVYKANGKINIEPIKDFYEKFRGELEAREDDGAEWYKPRKKIEVLSYNPEKNSIEWKPVKRILVKKYDKAVKITTIDGRVFIVSPDHPVLTKRRDTGKLMLIKAEKLVIRKRLQDSRIPVVMSVINSDQLAVLKGELEVLVDKDFAYFLGLYYDDGTLIRHKYNVEKYRADKVRDNYYLAGIQFSINKSEKAIRDFIVKMAEKLGCRVREWDDPRWPNTHYISLGCAKLARLLYDNGVSPFSDEKRVPWFIWNSPAEVRREFIRGFLDSDGYYRDGVWELHIKNEKLARDIVLLASLSNISAYLRRNKDGSIVVYFPHMEPYKHHREGMVVWIALKKAEIIEVDGLFIDVEVDGPHYFVHSDGVITHNCCRINIDKNELLYAYSSKPKGLGLGFSLKKDIEEQREESLRKIEQQRFGGLWAMPDITGSVNVTTVNLPRIAIEAHGDDDRFWELYDEVLGLVKLSEEWFRKRYLALMSRYPGMYSMIKEYLKEFPASHFNTIGILGLPEAAAIYLQEPNLWFEGSRRDWLRAAEVMNRMVTYAVNHAREWMKRTGSPWNVEEVPGESAAAKLAIKDYKLYAELGEYLSDPENPIYSTSIAPYYGSIDLPERIEIESRVQKTFTGGVMMHIFLGEEPDPEALAKLTKRLLQTDLVYWSYTPAITHCNKCGRTFTGLYRRCPVCGSEDVEVWSRIIGYYRPLKNWNPYRRKEFWTRRHYKS